MIGNGLTDGDVARLVEKEFGDRVRFVRLSWHRPFGSQIAELRANEDRPIAVLVPALMHRRWWIEHSASATVRFLRHRVRLRGNPLGRFFPAAVLMIGRDFDEGRALLWDPAPPRSGEPF